MPKKQLKLPEGIMVYFSEVEKEAIYKYMMTNTYHISFSTFLREIILKALKIK
jgi:dTDP-4-dehydrorhamnose 3,5-epimerase-like enzyme